MEELKVPATIKAGTFYCKWEEDCPMPENYGRRKGDIMLPPINIPNMTETQKVLNMMRDSLIAHDTRIQGVRNDVNDNTASIKELAEVVIIGTNSAPSHTEQLRTHQRFIDTIVRLAWLFVSAIVVQITAFAVMAIWVVARLYPLLDKIANQP